MANIAAFDPLRGAYLRSPQEGDYRTSSGALVADSCASEREKIEKALAIALEQIPECHRHIGMEQIRQTASVIRRTRYECVEEIPGVTAQNPLGTLHENRWVPFNETNQYAITLNRSVITTMTPRRLAETLLHEALHSTASNMRDWHNHASSMGTTCASNRFRDRVYLLTAACFPRADNGLLSGPFAPAPSGPALADCPGVCEDAFVEIDASHAGYPRVLAGLPIPPTAAREYCRRIRAIGERGRAIDQKIQEVHGSYYENWGRLLPPGEIGLRDLFAELVLYGIDRVLARDGDGAAALGRMETDRASLRLAIEKRCTEMAGTQDVRWVDFCANGRFQLVGLADRAVMAAHSIELEPHSLDRFVFPP